MEEIFPKADMDVESPQYKFSRGLDLLAALYCIIGFDIFLIPASIFRISTPVSTFQMSVFMKNYLSFSYRSKSVTVESSQFQLLMQ
jgi:hypothetical protein